MSKNQYAEYKKNRRQLAMTVGSEWAFFRNNDPGFTDPWSAEPIRIKSVRRDHRGRLRLMAVCINYPSEKPRRVYYSNLW